MLMIINSLIKSIFLLYFTELMKISLNTPAQVSPKAIPTYITDALKVIEKRGRVVDYKIKKLNHPKAYTSSSSPYNKLNSGFESKASRISETPLKLPRRQWNDYSDLNSAVSVNHTPF